MSISLNTNYLKDMVGKEETANLSPFVKTAHNILHTGVGAGNEFLGWVNLPLETTKEALEEIENTAKSIQDSCDVFLVIGIGGSYLGAKAAIDALGGQYHNQTKSKNIPEIYFIGNSISTNDLADIYMLCKDKDICINMISKSGTTTEPAIAFRIFRNLLIHRYGEEEAAKRIFCTTDKEKGTLKLMADDEGYKTFVIPDDIGGRFSVLTPVGLLPIAVAGFSISSLMEGAKEAAELYSNPDLSANPCYEYVALRHIMKNKGKTTEVLVSYEPHFRYFGEWYKQLFGESEGKDGKGIFPTSMIFSTDLHSLGQYVQDGSKNIFETVLSFKEPKTPASQHLKNKIIGMGEASFKMMPDKNYPQEPFHILRKEAGDFDGLNYLAGKTIWEINEKAMEGTILAHNEGNVPNILLEIEGANEKVLGHIFYFFMKACGVSGYLLGVNPFDQPGVEDYKKNMFALLGKPGFESRRKELEKKL